MEASINLDKYVFLSPVRFIILIVFLLLIPSSSPFSGILSVIGLFIFFLTATPSYLLSPPSGPHCSSPFQVLLLFLLWFVEPLWFLATVVLALKTTPAVFTYNDPFPGTHFRLASSGSPD